MPALITHHLFAQETELFFPEDILCGPEERCAYELGSQGPDPLFSRWSGPFGYNHTCHALAHRMHVEKVAAALQSLRANVCALPTDDIRLGRAFVLGLFAHYWLDSHVHPFVYAQQYALAAQDKYLATHEHEVHAVIEADIDSWLLWTKRREHAEDGAASQAALQADAQILRIGGALFSQTALDVFGLNLDAEQYGRSVKDYRRLYKALEPKGTFTELALTNIEELAREGSLLGALVHPAYSQKDCVSANTDHALWHDPDTHEGSHKDFLQLFEETEASWPAATEAFLSGEAIAALTGNRNYNGQLMGPDETDPSATQA